MLSPCRQISNILSNCKTRIARTEIKVPALKIIASKRRKRNRFATRALYRKRRHKYQQFRTSTNRRSKNIIVLQEPLWIPPADVELNNEANDEVHRDGGVYTTDRSERILIIANYWREDVGEAELGELSVQEIERDGDDESDRQGKNDPLVGAPNANIYLERTPNAIAWPSSLAKIS